MLIASLSNIGSIGLVSYKLYAPVAVLSQYIFPPLPKLLPVVVLIPTHCQMAL